MNRQTLLIITSLFFLFYFAKASNSKMQDYWFPCCQNSAWEQLTQNFSTRLELTKVQKKRLSTLAQELEPGIKSILDQKIIERRLFLKSLDVALADGSISTAEENQIKKHLKTLITNRMSIISVLLQSKILVDTILEEGQLKVLDKVDFMITLPQEVKDALIAVQKALATITECQETISTDKSQNLKRAFELLIDSICLPHDAKEVLRYQLFIVAKYPDFFLDRNKVIEATGVDISIWNMKKTVDEIVDRINQGQVDSIWLVGKVADGLGMPAVEMISKFGNIIKPLVVEVFLVSPASLGCNI